VLDETLGDPEDIADWMACLPVAEKDRLLTRVLQGEAGRAWLELLSRFHCETAHNTPVPARRTVAELLDATARRRADGQRLLAAQGAAE
jgi:hypothetical protein